MKYPFAVLAMLLAMSSWSAYADDLPHFKCFDIDKGDDPKEKVDIKTQFGEEKKVPVGRAKLLCEQVQKKCRKADSRYPPKCEDFYVTKQSLKCYVIYDKKVGRQVKLSDQFKKNDVVKVQDPRFLCTPADKKEERGKD
jgi:hypothetical protein